MSDVHQVLGIVVVAVRQMRGDRHGPVASPGTSDRHHEMRLPLGEVLREQEVEQRVQLLVERLELPLAVDELDDPRILSGERPEVAVVVRVREEADVEQQIGVLSGGRT